MAPYDLISLFSKPVAYSIYLLIGLGFGAVLEMAGFGDSRKLSAQFYFRDQTVLKVMFTAIVTAMILLFAASGLGLLDFDRVFVNPTYLVPGIVGGLIMGFGFIIGGFCPGTSLVAAATLKMDGVLFLLGVVGGIFVFGETVGGIEEFWHSTYLGRLTLGEWLGLETGTVVVLVVVMALLMFWGAEILERRFGGGEAGGSRRLRRRKRAVAAVAVIAALGTAAIGQPDALQRWRRIAPARQLLLDNRQVQIEPAELLHLMYDASVNLKIVDVRDEADFNLYRLAGSERLRLDGPLEAEAGNLRGAPDGTVVVLVSNGEEAATEAWKLFAAEGVLNLYLLEGGLNHWIETFGAEAESPQRPVRLTDVGLTGERLAWAFPAALGNRQPSADPGPELAAEATFSPRVELEKKKVVAGGCG